VLDYSADAEALGKNLGDDLAEGKATLPLIHAMAHADPARRARLRGIVEHGEVDALPEVLAAIEAAGSLDYSRDRVRDYARAAEAALAGFDSNQAIAALRGLARHAVERDR
jgi:octaprenyl-diphosphate synthase